MPDGYGLDPDEIRRLDDILHAASDEPGLTDFDRHATLESFLATQAVSRYENVEEPVEEAVLALTRFANQKYPQVVEAMQQFIFRAQATVENTAEGVAKAGAQYQVTESDVAERVRKYDTSD
ncbi:hypothetical protein AB8O38_15960 [Saccharomonospora xinjiangensis]|uniref:hypothetical protein n=1 Tax=Saccharomonospora xinjiangensis TaxID=75294 RepID=UPI003510A212